MGVNLSSCLRKNPSSGVKRVCFSPSVIDNESIGKRRAEEKAKLKEKSRKFQRRQLQRYSVRFVEGVDERSKREIFHDEGKEKNLLEKEKSEKENFYCETISGSLAAPSTMTTSAVAVCRPTITPTMSDVTFSAVAPTIPAVTTSVTAPTVSLVPETFNALDFTFSCDNVDNFSRISRDNVNKFPNKFSNDFLNFSFQTSLPQVGELGQSRPA